MAALLKWAGGKSRLAPTIHEHLGPRCAGTYIEPFLGSGAVFFHLVRLGVISTARLSDINAKLIEMFRAVQVQPGDVATELATFPTEPGWESSYYAVRSVFNEGPFFGPRHAARLLWLNHAGFNGLYRENKSGTYNVPVGRYLTVRVPAEDVLYEASELLGGAELVTESFEDAMKVARSSDWVYADPPYLPRSATSSFTRYAGTAFRMEEHELLASTSRLAAGRGARVVLSNHDVPALWTLYDVEELGCTLRVRRSISSRTQTRRRVAEVLLRPRAERRQLGLPLLGAFAK